MFADTFRKPCSDRDLSKTWPILLCDQNLAGNIRYWAKFIVFLRILTASIPKKLVLSCLQILFATPSFQHELSKTTHFTLWPKLAGNIGCQPTFSVSLHISTPYIEKGLVWGCFQLLYPKPCFQRELSKTWHIWLWPNFAGNIGYEADFSVFL